MPRAPLTAALALACLAALAGCGSSAGQGESSDTAAANPSAPGGSAEQQAPKGASSVLREIYRQFPKPRPNPAVKGSAETIEAGEAACRGKTPRQVREAFYSEAVENGSLEPNSEEAKMIAKLPSFEQNVSKDPSFVAGQLAADTYQATLPEEIAQFGYQGCAYALARGLERELAPRGSMVR
jgi:hypothetical protein